MLCAFYLSGTYFWHLVVRWFSVQIAVASINYHSSVMGDTVNPALNMNVNTIFLVSFCELIIYIGVKA